MHLKVKLIYWLADHARWALPILDRITLVWFAIRGRPIAHRIKFTPDGAIIGDQCLISGCQFTGGLANGLLQVGGTRIAVSSPTQHD